MTNFKKVGGCTFNKFQDEFYLFIKRAVETLLIDVWRNYFTYFQPQILKSFFSVVDSTGMERTITISYSEQAFKKYGLRLSFLDELRENRFNFHKIDEFQVFFDEFQKFYVPSFKSLLIKFQQISFTSFDTTNLKGFLLLSDT